ncbi:hypothetical protein FA13DRAFT_1739370 [Coprinellus micaceus]|uniref:Uncharacterized protein n=1 Tax=Coprinellus micaceus TaxID=71717 RepID=A0A4Y7SR50_COPMI|nr:hypothetical protein FA13DRAFT_1739370 [Coprinellus micaceus]
MLPEVTPTLTASVGQTMTGVVVPKEMVLERLKASKRDFGTALPHVTTTIVI